MPRTIAARENDKNGLKVVVNLKERGKTVDLTGYAIKYEAASSNGYFVRSDAVVTNAVNGTFEYTFSKESVATRGVWAGYFAFEKGTERYTTPDIKVILGRDVKQGSIEIKDYISEFDQALEAVAGYRKEIDATTAKITVLTNLINTKNVQVPKITLDNGGATIAVSAKTDNILDKIVAAGAGVNTIYCADVVENGNIPSKSSWRGISFFNSATFGFVMAKDYKGSFFTNYYNGSGGWRGWVEHADASKVISKLGDTMTGDLKTSGSAMFDSLGSGIIQGGGASSLRWRMYQSSNGECSFVPSATVGGSDWDWTKVFRIKPDGTIKQTTDTDWTNLTLINGVKQQSSQPASAVKRSGNVVNIVCAITDFKDKQVIANVPAIFRPDREMLFTPNYFQGLALKTGYVTVKPNGDIYLEGIEATVSLYRFALTYIV